MNTINGVGSQLPELSPESGIGWVSILTKVFHIFGACVPSHRVITVAIISSKLGSQGETPGREVHDSFTGGDPFGSQ